jgi:phospholipid/cholesterol/gamma-HCH transport system substrate-binding protein
VNPRAPRRGKVAALVAFAVLSGAVFLYLFSLAGGRVELGGGGYRLTATLPDGFALEQNAEVRAAGVRVGRVTSIGNQGASAVAGLELDDEVTPVYSNARVRLRTRTLVGENYVELMPGGPPGSPLPSGARLASSQSDESVQFDQILAILDPATRRAVRTDLRAVGRGIGDGTDLNALFDGLQGTAANGRTVLDAVHAQRRELARVIDHTATVLGAVSQRQNALRGLIADAERASAAAAARDRALRSAVRRLPGTLDAATETIGSLRTLSLRGEPAISALDRAAATLLPAVGVLGPTAHETRLLLRRIPSLAEELNPLLDRLGDFSARSRPAIGDLRPVLAQLEPATSYLRPYSPELGSVISNIGAFHSGRDALGNLARVQLLFDQATLTNALPAGAAKLLDALGGSGLIGLLPQTRANPYPAPGTLDSPQPLAGPTPMIGGPPGAG